MKLYSATWCTHCKPVKDFIAENELPVLIVDIDKEDPKELEKLKLKQIPCLYKEDGEFLYESKDILTFLGRVLNG